MEFSGLSAAERLIAEQAVLNYRSLSKACDDAADGKVLAVAETLAVEQGREFTRQMLQKAVDAHVEEVEKKVPPPGRANAE